jgi:NADP-dependent 3-hydroxy acid dehydrogenase YdfG
MAAKVSGLFDPWHKLDNEVVFITGASSGLGHDLCLDLAKAGCRIIAAARRLDRLHSLCHQINTQYGTVRAVAVELDVSADPSTINKSVQKAWDAFGHIDTLINNAGIRGIMK